MTTTSVRSIVSSTSSSSRRERGSRLADGSSSTSSVGSMASTVAIATRRRWPSESWCGARSATSPMRTAASASATRRSTSGCGRPMFSGPKATSSRTVGMNSWSSGSWKMSPTRAAHLAQRRGADAHAGDLELALAGQQAVEPQHQRRLAGAVRAEDGDSLAVRHVQVDAVERDVAVGVAVADAVGVDGAAHETSRQSERDEEQRDGGDEQHVRPAERQRHEVAHAAVVAAAQHREVDALAAGVACAGRARSRCGRRRRRRAASAGGSRGRRGRRASAAPRRR